MKQLVRWLGIGLTLGISMLLSFPASASTLSHQRGNSSLQLSGVHSNDTIPCTQNDALCTSAGSTISVPVEQFGCGGIDPPTVCAWETWYIAGSTPGMESYGYPPLPAGVTWAFNPTQTLLANPSTLTLNVASTVPPGTYVFGAAAVCPKGILPGSCTAYAYYLIVQAPPSTGLNLGCKHCTVGDPIDPTTGNLYEKEVDFRARVSTLPLSIQRSYNSQSATTGIFGNNWWSNLDTKLVINGTTASAIMPDGQQLPFSYNGSAWIAGSSVTTTLVSNGQGYLLTTVDQEQYQFNTNGQIQSETDAYGDKLTYGYSAGTMTVSDGYGNQMVVSFNGSLVKTIQVMGQTFTYGYDPAGTGNLWSVQFTVNGDAVSRQYLYENTSFPSALTGLIDETQQRYSTWSYDANGRAQSSILGPVTAQADHTWIDYSQLTASNAYANVTNANGLETNYYLQTGNDGQTMVPEINVLGSATVPKEWYYTSYDPTDDLPSAVTDWDSLVTTYTYYPPTPGDDRLLPHVVNGGLFNSPTPLTSTMYQTTVDQWHPVFPEPLQSTFTGTNVQGTMVDYKELDETYDNANGRVQTITEKDLTNYTVPYTSNGQTRGWIYTYTYWPNVGNGHSAVETETITGPLQDVTTLNFDIYGRLWQSTDASGHTYQFGAFTTQGMPTQVTDVSNGNIVTLFAYNERNQVTSVTRAYGTSAAATMTIQYYDNGPVEKVTLPDGYYLHYVYDDAMHFTEVDDSAGSIKTITPNTLTGDWQNISVTSTANSGSYQLNRTFDDLGRVISVGDSSPQNGGARTIQYNADNQILKTFEGSQTKTNPAEIETLHDTLNRLAEIERPAVQPLAEPATAAKLGVYETLLYGETGNLGQVTDARGLITSYTFDGLGDLMTLQSPDTGLTQFWPDAAGNVWKRLDNKGNLLVFTYDKLNRVREIDGQTAQQSSPQKLITYTYDQTDTAHSFGYGRLTSMTDASGTTDWAYDQAGRILSKTQITNGFTLTTSYTYSPGTDDIKTMKLPSDKVLAYQWTNGSITAIKQGSTPLLAKVTYQPFGGPLTWTLGNGESDSRYYDYNNRVSADPINSYIYYDTTFSGLHVQEWQMGDTANGKLAGNYNFTEDNYGHTTGLSGYITGTNGNTTVAPLAYSYDVDDNRLSSQTGSNTTTYTLDTASNRIASTTQGTTSTSLFYDPNGSLTGTGTNGQETYDVQGRLIGYSNGTNSGIYLYNGKGERVQKAAGSSKTIFVYDENGQLIGEYNGATGATIHEMVYLYGVPVSVLTPQAIYYVHADYRNTPRQIDDSNKNVVWVWDTKVYGNNLPNQNPTGQGVFNFNLRFPGQYYDAESGNFYNYFRDYNPYLGRYLESDPMGLLAGPNTYGYIGGNPLDFVDPSGLNGQGTAAWASKQVGSSDYSWLATSPYRDWTRLWGVGTPKCSYFANDALKAGGDPPPLDGRGPYRAGEWADPNAVIPGFHIVTGVPEVGDIVAIPEPGPNFTGHMGVYDPLPNGQPGTISASSISNTIVHNDWGFRDGQHPTIRRCDCDGK